jgi:hypothetical protein
MFYFLKIWFSADFIYDIVRTVYVLLPDIFLFLVWPMATVIPPLIDISGMFIRSAIGTTIRQ